MNILSYRNWFLGTSGALVILSWVLIGIMGIPRGIDFTGGAEWRLHVPTSLSAKDLSDTVSRVGSEISVSPHSVSLVEPGIALIRLPVLDESAHRKFLSALRDNLGSETEEISFSSVGPTIGKELREKSLKAVLVVLLGISLYVTWAFRKVSAPIASWKYGVVTLVTLAHDVSIPLGMLAVFGAFRGVSLSTDLVVALLVVIGFSVHDTIVVFDRIREKLSLFGLKKPLDHIVNESVKETCARSINTSLTLIFVLAALLFLGPASLFYFVLTVLVGTVFGTYSSICVASPLVYLWSTRSR